MYVPVMLNVLGSVFLSEWVSGLILETTAVHTIHTDMMIAQAANPSKKSTPTPPVVMVATDTGLKNERETEK